MYNFDRMTAYIDDCAAQKLVPSVAVAVGLGPECLYKHCAGMTSFLEDATPVNERTLYDMASITKVMGTTMVALRMMARGELEQNDLITRYIPNVPPDKRDIRIFHLMTHTSGLPAHRMISEYISSPDDTVRFMMDLPLEYKTGTKSIYSCMGYILLGKILEKICGADLDELTQREVFRPLGMTHTGYHPTYKPIDPANTALTERSSVDGQLIPGRVHDENACFERGISGNAGIFSDLNDVARFVSVIADHGRFEGRQWLPRRILDTACRAQRGCITPERGLGFQICYDHDDCTGVFFEPGSFGHTGFTGTAFYIEPTSRLWLAILTNRVHPTRANSEHIRMRKVCLNLAACIVEQ